MTTITYAWMDGCAGEAGTWTGDRGEAIARAAEELSATEQDDGRYRYHADEGEADYLVDADDMAELGAALLDGHTMDECYSIWCAGAAMEEVTMRAEERDDTWTVEDPAGGIWWPSTEAREQIAEADDPATEALSICSHEPMRGEWRQ